MLYGILDLNKSILSIKKKLNINKKVNLLTVCFNKFTVILKIEVI
jgi:hypothetical protein